MADSRMLTTLCVLVCCGHSAASIYFQDMSAREKKKYGDVIRMKIERKVMRLSYVFSLRSGFFSFFLFFFYY
jgi:hypothetical protein